MSITGKRPDLPPQTTADDLRPQRITMSDAIPSTQRIFELSPRLRRWVVRTAIVLMTLVAAILCDGADASAANINTIGFHPWSPPELASRYHRSYAYGRLWYGAELLGWVTKGGQRLPALVTASPGGTPISDAGKLGFSTTKLLFGNNAVFDEMRIGGRLRGGWWFDHDHTIGVEGVFFGIDGENNDFQAGGDGTNILARPFFNVDTAQQDARLIAFPTTTIGGDSVTAEGAIALEARMEFSGAEAIARTLVGSSRVHRIELIAGYRHSHLDDSLLIVEEINTTTVDPSATTITEVGNLLDAFQAENNFHGGEVGVIASRWWNRLAVQVSGKVAIGGSHSRIQIVGRTSGETTTTPAAGTPTVVAFSDPFGLLAQPSNSGEFENSEFAVMTEIGVNLEYSFPWRLKFNFGYTFMSWSDVARVLDQVDLGVDPTQAQPRPSLPFSQTDFWAQGIQGGFIYLF